MKDRRSFKLKSLMIFVSLCFITVIIQAQVLTGSNLDFNTGDYSGWVAKEGTYGGTSTAAIWNWSTTYNDPTTATDAGGRLFEIYSDTNATDSRTNNVLKKVPHNLGYLHSSLINNYYGQTNCSQLSYTMEVNQNNSLLTLNYAMVLEAPGHTLCENPTFQIDVMKHDPNNPALMLNQLVDSCAFFEKVGQNSNVTAEPTVWFQTGSWVWCKWQQIKINLAKYVGDRITLRIRLGDCCFTAHGAYGYVVAKAEKPTIEVAGCAGDGDTVTLAHAPSGFASYKWFSIPSLTSNQETLAQYDASATTLGTDSVFAIRESMMNGETQRFFAVKLISPRTQTTRPNCVAYISATVNDARPRMDTISYIPTAADNPNDEIGFKFAQVQPSAASYYLGWQRINFGDGDSTDFNYDEIASVWKVDSNTLTPRTRVVYTNNTVDTVYHTYMHNCMTYQVTRYAKTSENAECDSCMKSKTISVLVPGRPSLEIVDKDTICYGTSDTIIALSPMDTASNCTMDTNSFKYEWWYGNQAYTETPFYVGKRYVAENVTETTIIKIRVTDTASGFYRYKIDTIYVQAFPDITLTGDTVLCLGQTANITASDATGETVAMQWSFTEPASTPVITNPSTNPVLTFTPTKDTTVYLIAQTSEGCMAWKSIRIMITDPKVSSDKSKICPGESVVLTGSQAMDYSWTATPSDASLTEDVRSTEPVTVSPQVTTTYTMRGYGTSGCYAERQITITIVPYPTATITYSPNYVDVDDPILSIKDDSPNGASSMWTFSDGGTSTARTVNYRFLNVSVDSVGIELVSANELGCKDTTSVKVPVELFAVWVPNAFTPNGDGSNDYFFFMTRNQLEDVSFKIYNRWGENIFDREIKELDPGLINDMTESLGWDGKYKGKYVENGTYVWRLTYKRAGNTRVYDKSGTINVVK